MPILLPKPTNYEVRVSGASVEVVFKPTDSHYSFTRLVDRADIASFGPLFPVPPEEKVQHGKPGHTGEYPSWDVVALAYRLAVNAVSPKQAQQAASRKRRETPSVRGADQAREAVPVPGNEKGALSIARRRTR